MNNHKTVRSLLALIILLFLPNPARSQQAEATRTPSWLQLSFEHRTRYEHLTNPFRTNTFESEKVLPIRTRLQLGIGESTGPVRFLLELQDSRAFIDDDTLAIPRSHINELDFLQAQLQFNVSGLPSINLNSKFTLGRFTMDLGKRRFSARNRMRNTTNAFDGISWTLAGNSNWRLQSFFTRPVLIHPEELDSGLPLLFWGIFFESSRFAKINADLYYFGLHSEERTPVRPRYSTIGGRFFKKPFSETIDYEIETVWQFGSRGEEGHFAHFQHAELGYSFNSSWNPRLSFQYDYASGDADPLDNRSGRFFTLFGARRFEFNPTGVYGPFYRANIHTPGIRVFFNPVEKLQIMVAHRGFWLASAKDAWVGSGFQDVTGDSGKNLGQNFEVRMSWNTNSFLMVELGYARFFKGSYLNRAPESTGSDDSNFFYISTDIQARILPY